MYWKYTEPVMKNCQKSVSLRTYREEFFDSRF